MSKFLHRMNRFTDVSALIALKSASIMLGRTSRSSTTNSRMANTGKWCKFKAIKEVMFSIRLSLLPDLMSTSWLGLTMKTLHARFNAGVIM